jgi:CRISPR-associated protein Csb2
MGVNPYVRPTRFGEARYAKVRSWRPRRWLAFGMERLDGESFAAHWDEVQTVAAWARHAAGEALKQEELSPEWIDAYVLGHTGRDELGQRLSFVPLPSIGHVHADGGVRRLLITEPAAAVAEDAEALDVLGVKLTGWTLIDERGAGRAVLVPPRERDKVLQCYVGESRIWRTVTPVVLHGYNSSRGRLSLNKTDRLLRQAFGAAGVADALIERITFQGAPYWTGAEGSMAIRVPRHLSQWPRVHVQVEFSGVVKGPVLAGIGRHYGIGVFAAVQKE